MCRTLKVSAANILLLSEQNQNYQRRFRKLKSVLMERGEELIELAGDVEQLNACGLLSQEDASQRRECVFIDDQEFCPTTDYPEFMAEIPLENRLLEIDDQLSEFDPEPKCETDDDCSVLPTGSACGPRFLMPYSALMSQEKSDSLNALVTEYTELDRRLNFLRGGGLVCPGIITQSPRMTCNVGRCAVEGNSQRFASRQTATRQRLQEDITCSSKPAAEPGDYEFQVIFEARKPMRLGKSISLNDNGEIAFTVSNEVENEKKGIMLFTKMGIQNLADQSTSNMTGNFTGFGSVSLNDNGAVAFRGVQGTLHAIHLVDRGSIPQMIIASYGKYSFFSPALNNSGQIALKIGWDGYKRGLGITDGEDLRAIKVTKDFAVYEDPVINNNGTVAFKTRDKSVGSPAKLYMFKDGDATLIAADGLNTPYKRIESGIAINDLDHVAFAVEKHNEKTEILVYADGKMRTVVGESSPYEMVGSVVGLTDGGTVAFGAALPGPCRGGGIFTGPDPLKDKFLAIGDEIDGVEAGPGKIQMNNRGEFAFMWGDSVERLYFATPNDR